jgi:CHAD domain-containing protein
VPNDPPNEATDREMNETRGLAAAGIRDALVNRLHEMLKLRSAALDFKDPEGVHSMRVASRRLRSAATDFMPYLNKQSFNSILKHIRSIADALGEVRDQDVAILALEKLASEVPPEITSTVHVLIEARKKVRHTARRELKKTLVKDRLKQLRDELESVLEKASRSTQHSRSGLTYLDVARSVIAERLNELETLSDSLYKPLDVEALHEMRIAAKRLRYAIELFDECWNVPLGPFAKQASRLQSALGKVHDCDVWIESLGKEAADLKSLQHRKRREGLVWLFSHFMELRNTHFREAFTQWTEWETDEQGQTLRDALH